MKSIAAQIGNGVKSIEVSGRTIKFVLNRSGATLAEIKTFLDDDGSVGAVAARALVNIRIANGKDTAEINTAVVATGPCRVVQKLVIQPYNKISVTMSFSSRRTPPQVIIHDPWDKSAIIFDENVVIESIVKIQPNRVGEVGEASSEDKGFLLLYLTDAGLVRDFIVTLSSGNTITIQDAKARTQALLPEAIW